jgi:hypothetical protein
MSKRFVFCSTVISMVLAWVGGAGATPSTSYWTPDTIDAQPFLVPHSATAAAITKGS